MEHIDFDSIFDRIVESDTTACDRCDAEEKKSSASDIYSDAYDGAMKSDTWVATESRSSSKIYEEGERVPDDACVSPDPDSEIFDGGYDYEGTCCDEEKKDDKGPRWKEEPAKELMKEAKTLVRNLSERISYNTYIYRDGSIYMLDGVQAYAPGYVSYLNKSGEGATIRITSVKPILYPMTETCKKALKTLSKYLDLLGVPEKAIVRCKEYLLEHHIDYNNLIPSGLAIDANTLLSNPYSAIEDELGLYDLAKAETETEPGDESE